MAEIHFESQVLFFNFLAKFSLEVMKSQELQASILRFCESSSGLSEVSQLAQQFLTPFRNHLNQLATPSPWLSGLQEKRTADPNRIYMDGCFDLMHSGHFNALRQARKLGKVLVVGVHSDLEITRNKGPPVMNERERYAMLRACKWVDEVVEDAPYSPSIELLDSLNCLHAAHGDDLSLNEDGNDCMSILKKEGRCKIFKRTEGISTTQLVGKLLLMTRDVWEKVESPTTSKELTLQTETFIQDSQTNQKTLLTTSRRIAEFSNASKPKPGDKVVYIDGTFDLFHIGHLETIKKAKELGNYLIVGIHDDQTVNEHKGSNFPIMSLHDRVMCVLSMKYVDEVVMGAPWDVTQDLITGFNINIVVQGTVPKGNCLNFRKGSIETTEDPYKTPKQLGIYREVQSTYELDTRDIVARIVENRFKYFAKYQKTSSREDKYTEERHYVQEV